tara:strand:+ start:9367 stop:10335 length:969 start_codon:yes stop_codon:yes gene_type:complete
MKRLVCEISIGSITATFVKSFVIRSSWDTFTDTAEISIPRTVIHNNQRKRIDTLISVGDEVEILAGYFPKLESRFVGFVVGVESGVVTKIKCDDFAYLCKQKAENFSTESTTVETLINQMKPDGITVDAIDAEIGSFRVKNSTLSQVLDKIRKTYGVRTWFKGSTLIAGLPYISNSGTVHDVSFQLDIPIGKGDGLKYENSEDVKLKVKAVSILPNNKKLTVEVGDPTGEQRTFNAYNITSEKELKKLADQHLDDMKFTGFRGSFEMFGEPMVQHGDKVVLTDKINPDRGDGVTKYGVKGVETMFSVDAGFRQIVTLGKKSS